MNDSGRVTGWSDTAVTGLIRQAFDPQAGLARWIASGHWSDCFVFQHQGEKLVVRIGRHGEDFRKDAVASGFAGANLPVPAIVQIGQADAEHEYAVSDFVPGAALEQASNWHELVGPIGDLFEALCEVDTSGLSGWGRWDSQKMASSTSWHDFLMQVADDPPESRVHGWKRAMATSVVSVAAFERWFQKLSQASVAYAPRSIVHNDLFNRNAFVAERSITGVFDWGNSLIGDHLYDLALLVFWQPWLDRVQDQPVIDELCSRWSGTDHLTNFESRMQACLLHIGLEHMAYHSYLNDFHEVARVAQRIEQVMTRSW